MTPTNEDKSQQYVSDFLEKYVLESDTDSEGNKIPVLKRKSNELESASISSNQTLGDSTLVPDDNTSIGSSSKKESKWLHSRYFLNLFISLFIFSFLINKSILIVILTG